ncbi:MAG: hypothetical protein BIFFINMI_03709 [Phycisphaerae bacterium]|nr:hypothetical protein [Phycisphaerae bacterium]
MSTTGWRIGSWKILCGGMRRKEGQGLAAWPVENLTQKELLNAAVQREVMVVANMAAVAFPSRESAERVLTAMAQCLPRSHYADVDLMEISSNGSVSGGPHARPHVRIKAP